MDDTGGHRSDSKLQPFKAHKLFCCQLGQMVLTKTIGANKLMQYSRDADELRDRINNVKRYL